MIKDLARNQDFQQMMERISKKKESISKGGCDIVCGSAVKREKREVISLFFFSCDEMRNK